MTRSSFRFVTLLSMFLGFLSLPAAAQEDLDISSGDSTHGEKLFLQYCRGCHGKDGRGGAQTFMPHVDTLTKKGYIELVPNDYLFLVISDGGRAVGKSAYMPAWGEKLSDEEIVDIISHIRSLPLY